MVIVIVILFGLQIDPSNRYDKYHMINIYIYIYIYIYNKCLTIYYM